MINKTDVENITNELAVREVAKYRFKKGGSIESKKELQALSVVEMNRMLAEYNEKGETKEFIKLAKKMFNAVPELQYIPFWSVEIDTSVDKNLKRVHPERTYIEMCDMTMLMDSTFAFPIFAEEAFVDKYGEEEYSEWCDEFFDSYPYEIDWVDKFGDKLAHDSDIYVKMISRDLKFVDKIFSYDMPKDKLDNIYK